MPEDEPTSKTSETTAGPAEPETGAAATTTRKRAPSRRAAKKADATEPATEPAADKPADKPAARTRRRASKAADTAAEPATPDAEQGEPAAAKAPRRTSRRKATTADATTDTATDTATAKVVATAFTSPATDAALADAAPVAPVAVTFMAPEPVVAPPPAVEPARRTRTRRTGEDAEPAAEADSADSADGTADDGDAAGDGDEGTGTRRRRRGRRGRGRGKGGDEADAESDADTEGEQAAKEKPASGRGRGAKAKDTEKDADKEAKPTGRGRSAKGKQDADGQNGKSKQQDDKQKNGRQQGEKDGDADEADDGTGTRRRRRRRRRSGEDGDAPDDPPNTVVHVRSARAAADEVQGVKGSTRLEAKRQRRRDGRDQGRRRPPVLTEAEFLARREAVDRRMVVRQRQDLTQVAVLEDGVLVEHYATRSASTSFIGNVYLGKVQNVLPSMEAAFVDIGRGRNAVLYAGEVNWDVAGLEGKPRVIEQALKSGDSVLVQVTKDPVGHKGARLTSQISLPGRFLVYVPEGQMTGISRKLPDTERKRLKDILKRIVPEDAGVIIRTAAEGASEDELTRDVTRLEAQWQTIKEKAAKGNPPNLLNAEPDLVIRVVRDLFNEDFGSLVVQGDEAWDTVSQYVEHVSPDLVARLERHKGDVDVFTANRIDEQITKAMDRKVWLPSGGSLVIDRTEAMTVVDVNTGKFTGSGGNLEETVTRNNLEAAEEIVRQLRLRDIGGIIVVDFIDMVLESNRDLVLRRLTECLGRDRTKHQVAEVTSLGLVQMTRKRMGQGLLETFSETCDVCKGRGLIVHSEPVADRGRGGQAGGSSGSGGSRGDDGGGERRESRSRRRRRDATADDKAADVDPVAAQAAAQAMAKVALASKAESDGAESDGSAEHGDGGASKSGGRPKGARAADGAARSSTAAGAPAGTEPGAPAGQVADEVASAQPPAAPKTRRRVRRSASRPAGPPVAAET
jgi:ribonuclease E